MTLDILRMDVTKELLRKMEEERALFLARGHASNQVNALWKLVIILTNGDTAGLPAVWPPVEPSAPAP
jgi:hypothetical protein